MLDFVIFAITFVVFLILLVFYLYPGSRKHSTIPGLDPSDSKDGNISDILQAGSFPEFLKNLHDQYGEIASFWMGTQIVISIGSPKLFEQQSHVFDKPAEMYALYRPLVGENSILYFNGAEGRIKRQLWDSYFSSDQCNVVINHLSRLTKELVDKWSTLPKDQHIPLYQYMAALCMKVCAQLAFGDFVNDKSILQFNKNFEICWSEMESQVAGQIPELNSPKDKRFKEAVTELRNYVKNAIKFNKGDKSKSSYSFLEKNISEGVSENEIVDNALTFVVKFFSLAPALTWALYFVSSNENVQKKLYKELSANKIDRITVESTKKLEYLRNVVDESLRRAAVEPWTARYQDLDVEIGKHIIPKKTPVIQALEVVQQNEKYWSLPKTFDPDRFDREIETFAYCPFGFAGKRQCPAKQFSHFQMSIILKEICSTFELSFLKDQIVIPKYRMTTRCEDEVWVIIKKR